MNSKVVTRTRTYGWTDIRKWPMLNLGMCGMDFSSSVRFQFGFEKPRVWFGFGFCSVLKTVGSVCSKIQKKTCKLSFLCMHFAFWSTVF